MKNLHLAFLLVVVAIVVFLPPAITGGAISIDKTLKVDPDEKINVQLNDTSIWESIFKGLFRAIIDVEEERNIPDTSEDVFKPTDPQDGQISVPKPDVPCPAQLDLCKRASDATKETLAETQLTLGEKETELESCNAELDTCKTDLDNFGEWNCNVVKTGRGTSCQATCEDKGQHCAGGLITTFVIGYKDTTFNVQSVACSSEVEIQRAEIVEQFSYCNCCSAP